VVNWYPSLWACEATNFSIENLTIDGRIKRHKRQKTDFTVSAIHTRRCHDLRVLNVNVMDWPGDGISIQGGESAQVRGCIVEHSCGPGLHPGSGLTNSSWVDNVSRNNTCDGFYFCLRVQQAVVKGNLFYGNQWNGLGGLSDPDRYNIVADNIVAFNGRHGLDAPKAIGNQIHGNLFRNNSQEKAGDYAAINIERHRDNIIRGNLALDDQQKHTQLEGVRERDPDGPNLITENTCSLITPSVKKKA